VTIKRVSSELSPSALRKWEILLQVPLFHEGVAPHGSQQFLFGDQAVGVLHQEEKNVESLGVREIDESARDSVRLPGI